MKITVTKKLSNLITMPLLYLTFCMNFYLSLRGEFAFSILMLSNEMYSDTYSILANEVLAFFYSGVVAFVMFELITRLVQRSATGLNKAALQSSVYSLRFFFMLSNILVFSLKLTYLANPIVFAYGEILFDTLISAIIFTLFTFFCCKMFFEKESYHKVVTVFMVSYLGIRAVLTLILLLV